MVVYEGKTLFQTLALFLRIGNIPLRPLVAFRKRKAPPDIFPSETLLENRLLP